MSFALDARKTRDATLPYGRRVAGLHSCIQRYHPIGFQATLSFLEQQAGPYRTDDAALLRALDCLTASRELWKAAVTDYAAVRRAAKAQGQRTPRPQDPNPSHAPDQWYGAARDAALHALAFRRTHGPIPPATDDVATDVQALLEATLHSPRLTDDQRALLADLTAELRRRIRTANGAPLMHAKQLQQLTHLIKLAAVPVP